MDEIDEGNEAMLRGDPKQVIAPDGKPYTYAANWTRAIDPGKGEIEMIQFMRPDGRRQQTIATLKDTDLTKRASEELICSCENLGNGMIAIWVRRKEEPEERERTYLARNIVDHDNSMDPDNVLDRALREILDGVEEEIGEPGPPETFFGVITDYDEYTHVYRFDHSPDDWLVVPGDLIEEHGIPFPKDKIPQEELRWFMITVCQFEGRAVKWEKIEPADPGDIKMIFGEGNDE